MANKQEQKLWKIGLTLSVGLCFYFSVQAWGISVGVTPTRLEITGAPGEVVNQYFDVVGGDKNSTRIISYLGDWDLDSNGRVRFLTEGENPRSATPWVKINPAEFPVAPGNKRRVQVSVTIPKDAKGEYWTMAYFEARSNSVLKTTGVNMAGRIANAIYVVVDNGVEKKGAITGVRGFFGYPKGFQGIIRFENRGNVRLFPRGRIEIKDHTGKLVTTIPIEPQTVFPGSFRILTVNKGMTLKKGEYVILAILDYGGERLVAGQTTLKVAD